MNRSRTRSRAAIFAAAMLVCAWPCTAAEKKLRIATFNIQELSWKKLTETNAQGQGAHPQLRAAAEIVQRVRPDIVLINEIDYTGPADADDPPENMNAARLFLSSYLGHGQNGQAPLSFAHVFYRATNTGIPSGVDLNQNGQTNDPNDAYGFGRYPGEYGLSLFSRYPIDHQQARTFRKLLWKDLPDNLMPDGIGEKPAFYSPGAVRVLRLSSKSHWDVPVDVHGTTIHLLCSHPTPPVFDGPEDAHGRRNFDEIRFWRDYVTGGDAARWIRDDHGEAGGLTPERPFVILGDLNADPVRGEAIQGTRPIEMLVRHPRIQDPRPQSRGTLSEPFDEKWAPVRPFRTSSFGRLDYVLPSRELRVLAAGVFWPAPEEPGHPLARTASDHRLVWVDVAVP